MNERDSNEAPGTLRKTEEPARTRAKLKIFLGYARGVGKTYKMLELARELAGQQVEVAIGYVDVHGRYDISSLVLGLDVLPRRAVLYRGARVDEFDLEAALARKPRVLIVDELAHTNAPGGRHAKRWQDVLDLLEAGIEVHTTLNVQELESLNDVVAQITGVRVRETVPDAILDRADFELVDCPPEELAARLAEGKVYLPEQARRAAAPFFQRGHLLALRELALRAVAQEVGSDVQEHRDEQAIRATWPTTERIMVCVGPAPGSARLVRAASRMAASLRAPWIVVYVDVGKLAAISQADRECLESHLGLAESLGAEVVRLAGGRASEVLLEYARKRNVTRVVIGKPTHPRIRDILRGSLLDEIVRGSGDIDVQVISGEVGPAPKERARIDWWTYARTIGLVGLATGVGALARQHLAAPDFVMLYLLVIGVAAALFGRGPSLFASALSVLTYNFFFVPPFYTFAVADERHLLTFAMMFAVSLLTSGLTLRIRRQAIDARAREERTATLYSLSRDLGSALDQEQAALVIAQHASEFFGGGAAVLLPDDHGAVIPRARSGVDVQFEVQEMNAARWAFEHSRLAGRGTQTVPDARLTCVPLKSGLGLESLGVLAIAPAAPAPLALEERHFLDAFARQSALALERARLADEAKAAALRARTEEMRSSLLSAVSHDLRTPLAAITGAATTLRDGDGAVESGQRAELLDTICEEAERLERLVRNLLDMTQLESGSLQVKREWVPIEEVVGSALTRLESRLAGRPIAADLSPDLPLVSVDPVILEQVFVNLLENVRKYTPASSPIDIRGRADRAAMTIEVADRGPGLPAGGESRIFEKFFRGPHSGVPGAGLGLAICRGIVEAHGGTLAAENREGGGALFRITLPFVGQPPAVPKEAEQVHDERPS
jgi:two-component system sensor histidine kinase KdpD